MRSSYALQLCLASCAAAAGLVLCIIFAFVLQQALPLVVENGVSSFVSGDWYPLSGEFNMLPMLLATLYLAAGAVLLAAPVGIGLALFGRYYAPPPIARFYLLFMELLAGIPSVVFGLWGLTMLVPWVAGWMPPGASLFVGIVVLALMILPLVAITAEAALAGVPERYLTSAQALGLSRVGIIWRIILPKAWPGILSGIVLQSGRALGETMAVLMVTGNVVQFPESVFSPVRALTSNIALEMAYAMDAHRMALFVSGLLLLTLSTILVIAANKVKYA